ncbi:BON domain-containing protein [Acidovorax sp. JHL-9]|uniref:BON domain-containing protein n=1 Tax=Acidovorax sp. JHL-9 TaxID=1276756 RepID=UPI0004275221|nr:BON domain-containing protein [Acidovorax sp. JHL-9]
MNIRQFPHSNPQRIWTLLGASALAFGLAACSKQEEPTVGQKLDSAVQKTEQAAAEAQTKAESALKNAETKVEEGAATVQSGAQEMGSAAMGAVDDATITVQVSAGLAKDPDLSAFKIDVDTRAGAVTLTGPAPNASARERAETITKGVKGVLSVTNNLKVAS